LVRRVRSAVGSWRVPAVGWPASLIRCLRSTSGRRRRAVGWAVSVFVLVASVTAGAASAAASLPGGVGEPQLGALPLGAPDPDAEQSVIRSSLMPGESLSSGQSLHSPSGRYRLTLEAGGNLVLYDMASRAGWAGSAGVGAGVGAKLPALAESGWSFDAGLAGGDVPVALWDARTSGASAWALVMRHDGDLVLLAGAAETVWSSRTVDRPGAYLSVLDDGTVTVGHPDGRVLWTVGTSTPDVGLVGVRHVVYSRGGQRVWLIDADGALFDTYPVSGRATSPAVGSYKVFSKSQYTSSPKTPVTMRDMVRFVKPTTGLAIGFHSIPRTYSGAPIQTVDELGQAQSAGCVRQDDAKARHLFDWAPIGTPVVVIG